MIEQDNPGLSFYGLHMAVSLQNAAPPRGRLLPKILLALVSPILFLLLAEGLLRALNVGYPTGFLLPVTINDEPHWTSNPFYGYRFFHPLIARNPSPISVKQEKEEGTVRVVVLGESAAQGDPMLDYGMPRMLEKLLNEQAGTSRYEVINAAMTAINSHVIVDIARDIVAAQPDIAVIYMGNNEVIGPYGPGTTFTGGWLPEVFTPLRVQLTRSRLSQIVNFFRPAPEQGWSGLDMFRELHFEQDDPRLTGTYRSFEKNLERIISILKQEGVRVVVSTIAVNLSDCPPFGQKSARAAELYRRGERLAAEGDTDAARSAFKQARNHDTQRFRADARQNQIIREASSRMQAELVDTAFYFDTIGDDDQPPGDELFLDHVHFTFAGAWEVSRNLAASIREVTPDRLPSLERCRELMFFTPWAERNQALVMLERRKKPPLANQINNRQQIEKLGQVVNASSRAIREIDLENVKQQFSHLYHSAPDDYFIPVNWGAILMDYFRWKEAIEVMIPVIARLPYHPETRILPAVALAKSGQPEEAARLMVGKSKKHGYYLAEYGAEVMRQLERDGYLNEAAIFRHSLLDLVPRFPGREQFEL